MDFKQQTVHMFSKCMIFDAFYSNDFIDFLTKLHLVFSLLSEEKQNVWSVHLQTTQHQC